MPRNWYVFANGTGDGTSDAKPSGDLQAIQAKCGPGDTLVLSGRIVTHQWPAINRKGVHGMKIVPRNADGAAIVYDGADCITFQLSDGISIASGISIEEAGRDPTAPGFDPRKAVGHNAIHLTGCNAPAIGDAFGDVNIRFSKNGIVAEAANNAPTRAGTMTRVRMKEIWSEDQSTQGQGLFLMGMSGWLLDHCDFDECGWHHLVPGSATMFRHAIYSHHLPGVSGPYTARYCTFRLAASSGPTADSGCELDRCTIWNCSNVAANLPGSGAYQVWGGGDYSHIHDCTVFGAGSGILLAALSGDVCDNTIFWDGHSSPLGIDLQGGGTVQQRDATMPVNVYDNTIFVPPGTPIPPALAANPVQIVRGGPAVKTWNNLVRVAA